jgi:hypothetical protein
MKKYPAKDGWLHATLKINPIPERSIIEVYLSCGKKIEVAEYKELKSSVKIIYRYLTEEGPLSIL